MTTELKPERPRRRVLIDRHALAEEERRQWLIDHGFIAGKRQRRDRKLKGSPYQGYGRQSWVSMARRAA